MVRILVLSTLISASAFAGPGTLKNSKPFIVGGSQALSDDWKFTVSIQYFGSHWCGGVLIRPQWILTAAHCATLGNLSAQLGTNKSIAGHGSVVKVVQQIKHPLFGLIAAYDYDFALIKLETPVEGELIELNTEEVLSQFPEIMPMFDVAGWGLTENSFIGQAAEDLLTVQVPLVPRNACETAYSYRLTDSMFCAGYAEGIKDSCRGDSGGPLILNKDGKKVVYGLVSWGEECASPGKYGVYADVSKVKDWINETIAQNELPTEPVVE